MLDQKDVIIEYVKSINDTIEHRSVDGNDSYIHLLFDSDKGDSDLWDAGEDEVWDEDEQDYVDNSDNDDPDWIGGSQVKVILQKKFPEDKFRISSWAHEKGIFSVEVRKR